MHTTNAELIAALRDRTYHESLALRAALPQSPPPEITPEARYLLTITCPRCGGPLTHITGSVARPPLSLEQRVILECGGCRNDRFLLTVTLSSERSARKRDGAATAAIALADEQRLAGTLR